jgi:hypothetical protein
MVYSFLRGLWEEDEIRGWMFTLVVRGLRLSRRKCSHDGLDHRKPSQNPHFSQKTREMGHPGRLFFCSLLAAAEALRKPKTKSKSPLLAHKPREKWGTLVYFDVDRP